MSKTNLVTEESKSGRYAVIEFRRNEVFHRRFAISYHDEASLHESVAPSFIGIGFRVRETGAAAVPNSLSRDADSNNMPDEPTGVNMSAADPQSAMRCLLRRAGLTTIRCIASATLQSAVVAGVLMFYSRSVLGAVVRACVGA
jgi:copper oxidase (laccase) domain-containing protein